MNWRSIAHRPFNNIVDNKIVERLWFNETIEQWSVAVKPSTGRWVSGEDFFDRAPELQRLESMVCDGNHVLLHGQRRMGKTSIARELGRRLELQGWTFLFTDVEGATSPEDAIADIAAAAHPIRSISSRIAETMGRWVGENVDEISASEFRVKIRAGMSGSWRHHGTRLIEHLAEHPAPVLLVIDELPILLMRLLREDGGRGRVDEFLSWLRSAFQRVGDRSPVLVVSGSIGLAPLVQRLGIPDRINYLRPFRIGPWSRDASVECLQLLADSNGLDIDDGVADAVHEALGTGIPHHVQSYFAHLQDFAAMRNLDRITVQDVEEVYRTELLGASGQNDLFHHETRLRNALDVDTYRIAGEILAEAATQDIFADRARHCLERLYSTRLGNTHRHVAEAFDVLIHDGYLEPCEGGHRFSFRLLKDWWAARFRDHHVPLASRVSNKD